MHNDHDNKYNLAGRIGIELTLLIPIGVELLTLQRALADGTPEKRYYHLKTLFFLSGFCYNKGDSPVGISSVLFYFFKG